MSQGGAEYILPCSFAASWSRAEIAAGQLVHLGDSAQHTCGSIVTRSSVEICVGLALPISRKYNPCQHSRTTLVINPFASGGSMYGISVQKSAFDIPRALPCRAMATTLLCEDLEHRATCL